MQVLSDETTWALDAAATRRLQGFVRDHGLTLGTVVQVAWGIVLAKLTTQSDVVFGATVSGRPAQVAGIEEMIGLFVNTVPCGSGLTLTRRSPRWSSRSAPSRPSCSTGSISV